MGRKLSPRKILNYVVFVIVALMAYKVFFQVSTALYYQYTTIGGGRVYIHSGVGRCQRVGGGGGHTDT